MASVPMGARAYLRGADEIRAQAPLLAFIAELTRLGYYAIDHDEEMGQIIPALRAMDPGEEHLPPGPSAVLRASLADFVAGRRVGQKLRSQLFFPDAELYAGVYATEVDPVLGHQFFSLACCPDAGTISLETESKKFGNDLVHPRWMALTRAIYDNWRPLYLFPYYDMGESTNSREAILAGEVRYLHMEYNYFGPELAETLGRQQLLQTPGVRVAELQDGGVFIGQGDTREAAAYLGMTKSPNI